MYFTWQNIICHTKRCWENWPIEQANKACIDSILGSRLQKQNEQLHDNRNGYKKFQYNVQKIRMVLNDRPLVR